MLVNRVPVTIVGVSPRAFLGPEVGRAFDIALPIGSAPLILNDESWGGPVGRSYLAVVLRLAPGQSLDSAGAALRGMQRQMIEATLPPNGIWGENQDSQLKDPLSLCQPQPAYRRCAVNTRAPLSRSSSSRRSSC